MAVDKQVEPVKENRTYEVEVYVSYSEHSAVPFVMAGLTSDKHRITPLSGDMVERYVFEIEAPNQIKKKLKGSL